MGMKFGIGIVLGSVILIIGWFLLMQGHTDVMSTNIDTEVTADTPLQVVASFYPLAFIATEVAGEYAQVRNLSSGRDPHEYQPSVADTLAMQQADIVLFQGAGFESWSEDMEAQLQGTDVAVVVAAEGLTLHEADENHDEHTEDDEIDEDHAENEHAHGQYDPHTWLDPLLFAKTVTQVRDAFITRDPQHESVYQKNADMLLGSLTALDAGYRTALAECRVSEAIVSHDAFGYMADQYGLTMHAIAGISTQDAPSAALLATLRAEAAEGSVAILTEQSAVTEYADTLARETGLQIVPINPISYVIPEGEDYLTLMRSNLRALMVAYACEQ